MRERSITDNSIILDGGFNDTVFKKGNEAITVNRNIDIKELRLYQEVMAASKEVLDGKKIKSIFGELEILVNTITGIGETEEGHVYRTSPYIEGDNIQKMFNDKKINQEELTQFSGELMPLSLELVDKFKYKGINIIPYNTIILGNKLIVTDVCPNIQKLKKTNG